MIDEEKICKVPLPLLQKGDRGDAVRSLQLLLIGNGYSCGFRAEDGVFGRDTERALTAFAKDHGLLKTDKTDAECWRRLITSNGYEEVISQCRI